MFDVPSDVDPLLPVAVRGVRRCRGWLSWHLRGRWALKRAMEREGWRKDSDGWWPPDG